MQKITDGLYTLTGLVMGRVYLIDDGGEYSLIDAGIPPAGNWIVKQLQKEGVDLTAVKNIIITHAHPDHVSGVPVVQRATGAKLIVPEGERAVVDGEMAPPLPPKEELRGLKKLIRPSIIFKDMKADHTVQDGDILPVMGGLHAVFTPGHAPGHMSYWQPERRILFVGDAIFRMPRLRLPYSFLTVDMAENKRSIKKILALEPKIVCFGHGKPLTENGTEQLRAFAQKVGI
ncbi:MAG: MBL fold metallo-hydrolase [Chloroflexota bacterium]